jgi:hypothetical protein
MKLLGEIVYWNPAKDLAFVEHRDDEDGGITRYFLHRTKIIRRPAQITKGNLVLFEIGSFKPVRPQDLQHATNAEIFLAPAQAPAPTSKEARQ